MAIASGARDLHPAEDRFLEGVPGSRLAGANFAATLEPSIMLPRSPRASMLHARPRLRD